MKRGAVRKRSTRSAERWQWRPQVNARRAALWLGLPLVVVLAVVGVVRTVAFLDRPVQKVEIGGHYRYVSRDAVTAAIRPLLGAGFMSLDIGAIRNALQKLPWVYRASVRRVWPDTLHVEIEEQQPLARWDANALIGHSGEIFEPADTSAFASLPALAGPKGSEDRVMAQYLSLGALLRSRGMQIETITLDTRGAWQVTLKSGLKIVFGKEDLLAKLQRFLTIYDRMLNHYIDRAVRIDLRYRNGLAVAWRPGALPHGSTGS